LSAKKKSHTTSPNFRLDINKPSKGVSYTPYYGHLASANEEAKMQNPQKSINPVVSQSSISILEDKSHSMITENNTTQIPTHFIMGHLRTKVSMNKAQHSLIMNSKIAPNSNINMRSNTNANLITSIACIPTSLPPIAIRKKMANSCKRERAPTYKKTFKRQAWPLLQWD
jgi:hypothetical protein